MAHAPEVCYPGQGWKILSDKDTQFTTSSGIPVSYKNMFIEKEDVNEVVYSWWQTKDKIFAGNSWYHLSQIVDKVLARDTSSIWVRISAENPKGKEKGNSGEAMIRAFCEEAVPLFPNYFK
jgi:EpsI family protein